MQFMSKAENVAYETTLRVRDTCLCLHVQQAALTGESLPVEKEPAPADADAGAGPEAKGRVFLGSSVVAGGFGTSARL